MPKSDKYPEAAESKEAWLCQLQHTMTQAIDHQMTLADFERIVGEGDVEQWRLIQAQMEGTEDVYCDLCCLLAYRGVDYLPNLCHLLEPYYLRQYAPLTYRGRFRDIGIETPLYRLPGYLELLYRKHEDPNLLWLLLGLRQMGRCWRQFYMDTIASLWAEYSPALLCAAYGSQRRQQNLARALGDVCAHIGEAAVWRAYCQDLQHAIDSREWRLMRTAQQVRTRLHYARQRVF